MLRGTHEARPRPEHAHSGEYAYQVVREAILDGRLAPGTILSQVALAEDLGIGRTPLREALRTLRAEGLVGGEPNRRVHVAAVTACDLEELCVIRVTLEAEALKLSAPSMSSEDVAQLEGHIAQMSHYASEGDYAHWTEPHRHFHRTLTAHAGARVNTVLGQMFDHAERYRRMHIGRAPGAWATAGHRQILDACKARDTELAASLLAGHLAYFGFELCELLEPGYLATRLSVALADAGGALPSCT